jgi:hypothetical protein
MEAETKIFARYKQTAVIAALDWVFYCAPTPTLTERANYHKRAEKFRRAVNSTSEYLAEQEIETQLSACLSATSHAPTMRTPDTSPSDSLHYCQGLQDQTSAATTLAAIEGDLVPNHVAQRSQELKSMTKHIAVAHHRACGRQCYRQSDL